MIRAYNVECNIFKAIIPTSQIYFKEDKNDICHIYIYIYSLEESELEVSINRLQDYEKIIC